MPQEQKNTDATTGAGDAEAPRMDPEGESCRLGVLFVHGIGEQVEGDTLIAFGEPLIAWMRQWIEGHGMRAFAEPLRERQRDRLDDLGLRPDGVEAAETSLLPSRRASLDPPHSLVRLRFSPQHEPGQRQQCWLFAESWWGEQVKAPPVFTLLGWMFSRGPWIALTHFAERALRFARPRIQAPEAGRLRRAMSAASLACRQLVWPAALVAFLLTAVGLQLLLLIATLFALIPLPMVRRYVAIILQRTTSILGDSYGLVANEAQRGAILTRFRDTFEWLHERCDKVAIVAHSQGAAVVHAALDAQMIRAPGLVVTFGAGVAKLAQLRHCEVSRRVRLLLAGWIAPSLLAAVAVHAWAATRGLADDHYILLIFLYMSAFMCTVGAYTAWQETRAPLAPALKRRPGRWIDLYASDDPVPQGALDDYLVGCDVRSERIINRRSAMSDHTAYWKNHPEFVSRIAFELDQEAELLGVPDLATSQAFRRVRQHHRDAILILSLAWWGFILPLIGWSAFAFNDVAASGRALLDALGNGPLRFAADYVLAAGAATREFVQFLTNASPAALAQLGYAGVVVGVVLLVAYLWWKALVVVFTKWNSALLADFLGYEKESFWGANGTLLVWPILVLFALAPFPLVMTTLLGADPLTLLLEALTSVIALTVLILLVMWVIAQPLWARLRALLGRIAITLRRPAGQTSVAPISAQPADARAPTGA